MVRPDGAGAATAAGAAVGGTPRHPPATRAAVGARVPGQILTEAADAGGGAAAGGPGTLQRSRLWSIWRRRRRRRLRRWRRS